MNNLKKSVIKTTVFFVIFSSLAAYYYFIEIRHKAAQEQQESQQGKILQYDFADCTSVLITRPDAALRMSKTSGPAVQWRIETDKINALADANSIEDTAGALFGLVPSRILLENAPADTLTEFGLTKETGLGISFTFGSGAQVSCLFGDTNPSGKAVYMQISNDPRVFLVPQIIRQSLMYPAEHFRERRIIHFAAADVSGLKISHGGDKVALARNEKRWNFEGNENDSARKVDRDKIISLLSTLSTYMAEGFIDEPNKEELESFETAQLTIELTLKDGVKKTITLGNTIKDKDVKRFVKTDEVDYLLKVNADYMEKFAKTGDFFISRKIIEFDPWEIGKAEIKTDSAAATLTRKDFKWVSEQGKEINLSEFLWALTECRYKNISASDPAALESKAALVLNYKKGPSMPEIVFLTGKTEEGAPPAEWFISFDDKLFEVDAQIGAKLGALTDELRNE